MAACVSMNTSKHPLYPWYFTHVAMHAEVFAHRTGSAKQGIYDPYRGQIVQNKDVLLFVWHPWNIWCPCIYWNCDNLINALDIFVVQFLICLFMIWIYILLNRSILIDLYINSWKCEGNFECVICHAFYFFYLICFLFNCHYLNEYWLSDINKWYYWDQCIHGCHWMFYKLYPENFATH